jgi:hypothetical protein
MSGWSIIISQATPDERDSELRMKHATLATWDTGVGGLQWLETLAKIGKATQLRIGGYPTRFIARADDILQVLESGPPPGIWISQKMTYPERIATCPPDRVLTIDAWDLS